MIRDDLEFRHEFCSFCAGLEGARTGGQVIVLYINDFHAAFRRPFDGGIQSVNDVPVVLGDIVLYIDDNKGFMVHVIFLQGVRYVKKLFGTR